MANVNAPFGFKPVRRLDGAAPNFNQTVRKIAAANAHSFFFGDVVVSLGTGYIDTASPGTTQVAGIFVGCKYLSTSQQRTVWNNKYLGSDAAADIEAYIIDDPLAVFQVQCKTGPIGISAVDNNANFATGTGNTASGMSGQTLDDGTINTTSTLPFRIVSILGGAALPPFSDFTSAYNIVEVAFNNQDFKSLTGI